MKIKFSTLGILVVLPIALLNGCTGKDQVASPACAELATTTDPKLREELSAKCPRGGDFVPSPQKSYNFN